MSDPDPTPAPVPDAAPIATPPAAPPAPDTLLGGAPAPAGEPATPPTPADPATPPETPDPALKGAPEKYEFAAPEGVTLNPAMIEKFEPLAREFNLSNEQANKLMPLAAEIIQQHQQAQAEAWGQQIETWGTSVKADKEIGGLQFDASLHAAQSVITKYGTPELSALMRPASPDNPGGLGLGNHPELFRVFARLGKAMGEAGVVRGSEGSGETPGSGKKFYPGMNP